MCLIFRSVYNLSDMLNFQDFCGNLIHSSLENSDILQSLTCGFRLAPSSKRNLISSLGLLHFFVVSGAHLSFIECSMRTKSNKIFSAPWLLCVIFALMTGFSPPVFRALVFMTLFRTNSLLKLYLPKYKVILFGCVMILVLRPHLVLSASFQLSLLATLVIYRFQDRPLLVMNTLVWLLLSPLIGSFSTLTPWAPLNVALFSPVFTYFAFPLSFLGWLPVLDGPVDRIWSLLLIALQKLPHSTGYTLDNSIASNHPLLTWGLVAALIIELRRHETN